MQNDVEISVPILRPLWLNVTEEPVVKILVSAPLGLALAFLANGDLRIVKLESGETVKTVKCHRMGVITAELSPSGREFVSSGEDSELKIFDLTQMEFTKCWKNKSWIECVNWNSRGLFFSSQKKFYYWDLITEAPQLLEEWNHSLSAITLKNEAELGVAGYSRFSIYDLKTLKLLETFDWKGQLQSLQFSPNERYSVSASQDLTLHIWDLKRNRDLSMRGFPSQIRDHSFRSDGLYMANTSGQEFVVWDFMDPGPQNKKPQVLGPFEKPVNFVKYQNSGKMLASFGEDGVILFWRPDLFEDRPLAIGGIRDQAITSALWSLDDRYVLAGLQSGYLSLYPAPEVRET